MCDPLCCAPPDLDELPFYRTYDVLPLGKITQGTWRFELSMSGNGDSMKLHLRRWRKPLQKRHFRHVESRSYPIYFDRGSNCIHVEELDGGIDGTEVEGLQGTPRDLIVPNVLNGKAAEPIPETSTEEQTTESLPQRDAYCDPTTDAMHFSELARKGQKRSATDTLESTHSLHSVILSKKLHKAKPSTSLLNRPPLTLKQKMRAYRAELNTGLECEAPLLAS